MKKMIFSVLCLMLGAIILAADAPFAIKANGKTYTATFKGLPLIVGEGFTPGFAPERTYSQKIGNDLVLNACGKSKNISFRREVATVDGGKELEITFQARIPALNTDNYTGVIQQYIEIPVSLLDGCNYTAWVGGHKRNSYKKGKINAAKLKSKLLLGSVRTIAFSKKDFDLVVDFNPSGAQDLYSSYSVGSLSGQGGITIVGDKLRFSMGTNSGRNGGIHTGKIVIYEGLAKDFAQRRAHDKYGYCSELPADKRLVFGAKKAGKGKARAHLLAYTPKRSFGWLDNSDAQIENFRPQGTLYSAVYGTEKARFRVDLQRRGLYIVTINTGTGEAPVKAMDLSLNNRELVKALAIAPKTAQKIQVPMWIEDNKAIFEFSGDWRVSEIAFQLLLAGSEDFSIRRAMWRSDIKDYPSVFYHNSYYADEPPYNVHLSNYPLPEPGKETAARPRLPEITTAYGDLSKLRNNVYSAMIGSWGTGNAGTFTEFSDPGIAERNIEELIRNKINIVMFNGMLARHTFADAHKERLHKEIARYIALGKQANKNFLFIDHIDYSMLWNSDSGFRRMLQWNDRLQETVDGGLPGRARCMTNPKAVEEFYNTITEHIRKTGLDGLMVDECIFMGKTFCGCASCRKLFAADTGCQLPADELSPELYNPRSPLWRAWEEWRRRKIGEFWVNLRKRVAEFKKDFIFIGYTTHYGLTSDWATNDLAGDLFNYSRAWDMVGTEIMPRNIFANSRAVNSLRKAFSLFGRNGKFPVFGLVYATDWKIKYFGWAVNNLNGQQTWETRFVPCPEGEVNYHTFTAENGNMDLTQARSSAKIALLFSESSRNLVGSIPAAGNYRAELLGTSQILSMMHIDHDIISQADLTPERLQKYQVLMLGNTPYLNDKELAEIKRFAENGGVVTASFMTGVGDEFGKWRKNDFISSLMGWKPGKKIPSNGKAYSVSVDGKNKLPLTRYTIYRNTPPLPLKAGDPVIYNAAGRAKAAMATVKVGQGKLIYFPGQYGFNNCANELMVGKKFDFKADKNAEFFQKSILEKLLGKYRTWYPTDIPEGILTASYWQNDKFVLHFLNAQNAQGELGKEIKFSIGENPFPEVPDMSFRVPFKVRKAYAVSPDFAGIKELKFMNKGVSTIVTLPGELLKVYTLVYLEK
ncbi:MAG: beta-galactosidase trimerization domain-containing protein [Lentisphaeria bacterium]|nr:beta-galactosidase trimerization domain-containing protein [Lentisphaeria bacterium]